MLYKSLLSLMALLLALVNANNATVNEGEVVEAGLKMNEADEHGHNHRHRHRYRYYDDNDYYHGGRYYSDDDYYYRRGRCHGRSCHHRHHYNY